MHTDTLPTPESGYIWGWSYKNAAGIDREVIEAEPCPDCGVMLHYRPYYRPNGKAAEGSYRAYGICPCCGYAIEF